MIVDEIVAAARSQLGVPFSLCRRYDGTAVDCVGLLEVIAVRCGIPLKTPPGYSQRAILQMDTHALALACGCAEKNGPAEVGDIVRLEMRRKCPFHFGVVVGETFIHACDIRKKVVEEQFRNCADQKVCGVYAWPK